MIYLIGALKDYNVPVVANQLREKGFEVHDDWYSPGPHADEFWQRHQEKKGLTFQAALDGPHAWTVFRYDKLYLDKADAVVMVMPCGKSGHLEFGYAVGTGKPGFILMDKEPERWDVMYRFATAVCMNVGELIEQLYRVDGRNDE